MRNKFKENTYQKYRNLFFVSLLFIVLFAVISFYLLYQSQQAQRWNEHRRQMDTELTEVLSGIHEMSSSTRGYILTGQVESIVPYKQAFNEVTQHLAVVDSLSTKDPQQKKMVDTLKILVKQRTDLLDILIDTYKIARYSKDSASLQNLNEYVIQGDLVMNKIRIQVKSMVEYEQYLYKERVSSGDNFNRQAYILIICFGIITITVSLYGYLIIQRENRQKNAVQTQLDEYYTKVEKVNTMLTEAEKIAKIGSWEWEIESGKVYWSDGLYKVYGLAPDKFKPTYESFISIVSDEDRKEVTKTVTEAVEQKKSYQIEFKENTSGQNRIVYAVGLARLDVKNNLISYYGIVADITQQRNYEIQLEDFNNALKRSNEELEQFAYVASHDLQEPLRKIRAFGDRLMYKHGDDTDMPGRDYVIRMMDGAERMQVLIQDLLSFSRVSRDVGDKVNVDLNVILNEVLEDLQLSINESDAGIKSDKLPKITSANPMQMHQLFLNLISNAIKFRKPDVPSKIEIISKKVTGKSIHITDEPVIPQKMYYAITIKDNGIGFDEKYLDKIFTIFQRLHGRTEYKGTGIGLALCKKICKNHEGFITAHSDNNSGAEFTIYLPA